MISTEKDNFQSTIENYFQIPDYKAKNAKLINPY